MCVHLCGFLSGCSLFCVCFSGHSVHLLFAFGVWIDVLRLCVLGVVCVLCLSFRVRMTYCAFVSQDMYGYVVSCWLFPFGVWIDLFRLCVLV